MIQMVRTGEDTWELTDCTKNDAGVYEYTLLARLVRTPEAWFVEAPQYQDIGHYWERQERPFITAKAAIRSVTEFSKRAS